MTDGKTLKTTWFDMPPGDTGCRRGHIDSQDRVWCGGYNANDIVMFDPKTKKITDYKANTPWTRPYDAEFDDKTYAWGAGMDSDRAVRVNVQTGEVTEYLLPHETNVRHVEVQKIRSSLQHVAWRPAWRHHCPYRAAGTVIAARKSGKHMPLGSDPPRARRSARRQFTE